MAVRVGDHGAPVGERQRAEITITALFTDIEGSTRQWDDFPDDAVAAIEQHDRCLRSVDDDRVAQEGLRRIIYASV